MKKLLLLCMLFTGNMLLANAQSVAGTWKRLSTTLEYKNGKKEDLQQSIVKSFPCAAQTKYIFKQDGSHYSQSPKGCEMIDQMSHATWKQTGNTVLMTTKKATGKNSATTSYAVSFSGSTMTLTHVYTDAENKESGSKVKQLITIYQRI